MFGFRSTTSLIAISLLAAGCASDDSDPSERGTAKKYVDPGSEDWVPVPRSQVLDVCRLDPELLDQVDRTLNLPWGIVRYGRLCHEFYPKGATQISEPQENFSATKTLGALVVGIAAYQTKSLARTGRKTGPLSDLDRADHWLDEFTFNKDAHVAHVLAMVAHNPDLSLGAKQHTYDIVGDVQINRLSDIVNAAIAQDAPRLGANIEEFTQRFLFQPLGMRNSTWTNGAVNKIFAYTWASPLRDMMRLGLLMLNDGVWSGQRVLDAEWIYRMTHPAFEDANTSYGYLTWLSARSNFGFGLGDTAKLMAPMDPCQPAAIYAKHPHGLSESKDCFYANPADCVQKYDVGVWHANGANGQLIVGMKGLDLVIVVKDLQSVTPVAHAAGLWPIVRSALIARDPKYVGDEAAFCQAYGQNDYAPDLAP